MKSTPVWNLKTFRVLAGNFWSGDGVSWVKLECKTSIIQRQLMCFENKLLCDTLVKTNLFARFPLLHLEKSNLIDSASNLRGKLIGLYPEMGEMTFKRTNKFFAKIDNA